MISITATAFRKNLYNTIEQVNTECTPITITNSKGKSAVLIGEDEWAAIEETLYLMSIPGFADSLKKEAETPIDECVTLEDLDW